MRFVTGLRCVFCGRRQTPRTAYTCSTCGITGILDVEYDYAAIARALSRRKLAARREFTHWRYRELLPVSEGAAVPDVAVGWTPLTAAPALARHIGVRRLYVKDEGSRLSIAVIASARGAASYRQRPELPARRNFACRSCGRTGSRRKCLSPDYCLTPRSG